MPVLEQYLDLPHAALFGNHDHAAQLLELVAIRNDLTGVELLDRATEHALDEMIDMAAGAIDLERHFAPQLEPAPEHAVVLFLVGAVFLDRSDKPAIVGAARPDGLEHPVERGIAAVLVIDVDGREHIENAAGQVGYNTQAS